MASESSSAMLDLNDADTEDTEPPSVTDDARDGPPLIMEHGYDIAVKVDAPMKQLSTLETFVTYRVRCVCARWPTPPYVRRRYNHFKALHRRVAASCAWVAAPPLPPLHSARQQLDRYSAGFVAARTRALHAFLDRMAKHPIFTHNEDFRLFLTTPDEEFDKVFKSENSALNLWGLSAALYGSGESKPNANGARVKDPEWSSQAEYLSSLQHKLAALCDLTNKLHAGTLAVTTEMMNMKRVCDAWASQSRGGVARGAGACGAGAAARHPRLPPAHRALLPLLAAYTAAHQHKIRQRDQLHAAYVSGTNATGEMHNKLEQCSEALRSELADWLPKTRSEIKSLLLELADSQVNLHTQVFANWDNALRLSQDANTEELFKTVSKNAVQNLSPSKCRSELTPTETERDMDDLENYSNDSDSIIERDAERSGSANEGGRGSECANERGDSVNERGSDSVYERGSDSVNERGSDSVNERGSESVNERGNERSESERTEWVEVNDINNSKSKDMTDPLNVNGRVGDSEQSERENGSANERSASEKTEWVEVNDPNVSKDPLNVDNNILSEILDETEASSSKQMCSKPDVVSDPLKEFSDVDLS